MIKSGWYCSNCFYLLTALPVGSKCSKCKASLFCDVCDSEKIGYHKIECRFASLSGL